MREVHRTSALVVVHSVVSIFATPWAAAHKASLSLTTSQSLLKLKSIESMVPSNHLILCRPLLLLPSVFSSIRVFSNELTLPIRWLKYWFLLQHQSFQCIFSVDFFRMDWFDLLAVQLTLKSALEDVLTPYLPPYLESTHDSSCFLLPEKMPLEGPLFEKARRLLGSSHSQLWI